MKNHLYLFTFVLAMLLVGCSDDRFSALDLANYHPVEEFVPAYEALQPDNSGQYDIEKTVRIINALEHAQANSENFDDFLVYMARQDYTGVAPDVLEAKKKFLPILQYMYKLQKDDEALSDVWMLVRGAAHGTATFASEKGPSALFHYAIGDAFALVDIITSNDAEKATDAAFDQYEKDKELKGKIQEDLQQLRTSYLQYLTDYAPIYHKYMKEYDAMCVTKDKAWLSLYDGHMSEALSNADQILSQYPNNSEAMLIRAFSLISIGSAEIASGKSLSNVVTPRPLPEQMDSLSDDEPEPTPATYGTMAAASVTIDDYIHQYPSRTAPALVLRGLMAQAMGHESEAISCFDQASIEYPKQAADLTDMLDAYRQRTYLNKTPEGQYLLRLYRTTMEGSGVFSPNLLKAKLYADKGDTDRARTEIFNHFFRSSNQGIYDNLLTDMQFCEQHLYGPFRELLLEQSFFDVSVAPESSWIFWDSDDVLRVKLNNRSDIDLENVRLFLCIHYTDMYTDQYDVVKVPKTVSSVPRHSVADFDTIVINRPDKTTADITRIRAIAVTDDRICWVDDANFKQSHALAFLSSSSRANRDERAERARSEYLSHYNISSEKLTSTLLSEGSVRVLAPEEDPHVEKDWWDEFLSWFSSPDNNLKIELPRILTMIDPVFSIAPLDDPNGHKPTDCYLTGTSIRLEFDFQPAVDEVLPLYIYSDYANFRVTIQYNGAQSFIKSVEVI